MEGKQIAIYGKTANEVMDIVRNLRESGCVQGQDFNFSYGQSKWDIDTGPTPAKTIFTFHSEKWASLFVLKYL